MTIEIKNCSGELICLLKYFKLDELGFNTKKLLTDYGRNFAEYSIEFNDKNNDIIFQELSEENHNLNFIRLMTSITQYLY
jgi:hypothetical protein